MSDAFWFYLLIATINFVCIMSTLCVGYFIYRTVANIFKMLNWLASKITVTVGDDTRRGWFAIFLGLICTPMIMGLVILLCAVCIIALLYKVAQRLCA